jgi:hypothetical protein
LREAGGLVVGGGFSEEIGFPVDEVIAPFVMQDRIDEATQIAFDGIEAQASNASFAGVQRLLPVRRGGSARRAG